MPNNDKASLVTTPHFEYNQLNFTRNYILDKAQGHWPEILESLGVNASYLKDKHGPCPACGGKDRFRFDDQGIGRFICSKCGSGNGIKLLRICFGWDYLSTLRMISRQLWLETPRIISGPKHVSYYLGLYEKKIKNQSSTKVNPTHQRFILNNTWKGTQPITIGDPVSCYLTSRGISLNGYPVVLRYHPSLPYFEDKRLIGKFPGMVALVTDCKNIPVTLHRTYLGDGCKANVAQPKKLMSPIIAGATRGAAIKLFAPTDGILALAEGIETALAFNIATQLPVWATISAGGMEKIIIPPSITDITIAVDNDASGCGQKAAYILSRRLISEGRKVKRVIPPKVGQDFNDILLEAAL